jgi:hypothetical protein
MRQKNAKFANDARVGKKPTKMSRIEKQAKQSPIPVWTLGVILFVVCGGGMSGSTCMLSLRMLTKSFHLNTVIFELVRLIFV